MSSVGREGDPATGSGEITGIWRAEDRVFRPWKNGGGETAEIAIGPIWAGIETFLWRVSTAIVASDGPFSVFPGIDRVLTVIEGGPMRLMVAGREHRLDAGSRPFAFAGDLPAEAWLDGPALLDFNVMVRRPLTARVVKGPLALPARPAPEDGAHLALLLEGRAGMSRLDLVDLDAVAAERLAALVGVAAIRVEIGR